MNILLIDDHVLFRQGLAMLIEEIFPQCCIHQFGSWEEAYPTAILQSFDLILLDIFMPRSTSWDEELNIIIDQNPTAPVCIISTSSEQEQMQTAFKIGVRGYICKTAEMDEITRALLSVSQGKSYFPPQLWQPSATGRKQGLTLRQQEILRLTAKGNSNKQIAQALHLTENTVKQHIYNICQTFNVHNRIEAVEVARQRGLLDYY